MAVSELLNPEDGTETIKSWQLSRLSVCATLRIVRRLRKLEQQELINECFHHLRRHQETLKQAGSPLEAYFEKYIA